MKYNLTRIAVKVLRPVEIHAFQSNQHEFHGVSAFKHVFGVKQLRIKPLTYYIDDKYNVTSSISDVTWYDAREYSPDRSEYRLYYKDNVIFNKLEVDDFMILAKSDNGDFVIIFIKNTSALYEKLSNSLTFTIKGEHYILLEPNDIHELSIMWGFCDNNKNIDFINQ